MKHLQNLQSIADANDDTRASGTPGYAASRDYVVDKLRAAGYSPTVQEFDLPVYRENSDATMERVAPTAKTYVVGTDFATMTYSGSGQITVAVTNVNLTIPQTNAPGTTLSGCLAADFAGFPLGNIALIQRGTCSFGIKAVNAQTAGASAVVIMNEGQAGRNDVVAGTLGAPDVTIPVLGTSYAVGVELSAPGTVPKIGTDTESAIRTTYNVLAETAKGNDGNVAMAGAHLDSVVAGPGINDNGSGSGALLEIAEQFAKVSPKNTVRFAWWGAEELGLLGSEHYVADLVENDPAGLADIALYLNFDMVGSPNYVRFVYDGDNSRFPSAPAPQRAPKGRVRSRTCSTTTSPRRTSPPRRPRSRVAVTTGPSSPKASRPVVCSPAPRASRPPSRQLSSEGPRVWPTTRATTRPATPSRTCTRAIDATPTGRPSTRVAGPSASAIR